MRVPCELIVNVLVPQEVARISDRVLLEQVLVGQVVDVPIPDNLEHVEDVQIMPQERVQRTVEQNVVDELVQADQAIYQENFWERTVDQISVEDVSVLRMLKNVVKSLLHSAPWTVAILAPVVVDIGLPP